MTVYTLVTRGASDGDSGGGGAAGPGVLVGGTRVAPDGSLSGRLRELVGAHGHVVWINVDASLRARDGTLCVEGASTVAFGPHHHWVRGAGRGGGGMRAFGALMSFLPRALARVCVCICVCVCVLFV
jgi:hypothetical protein